MAIHTLSIFRCPFCPSQTGQIMVDAAAMAAYRAKFTAMPARRANSAAAPSPCLDREEKQKVIVFNAERPNNGPCPHLLDIQLNLDITPPPTFDGWGASYDWRHAAFRATDPAEMIRDFLFADLLYQSNAHEKKQPRLHLRALYCHARCDFAWQVRGGKGQTLAFGVDGGALFVHNMSTFLMEVGNLYANRRPPAGRKK